MGSTLGVLKTAATRVGMSLEEYQQRQAAGEKWCTACKDWRPIADFHKDASRGDGLKASCKWPLIQNSTRPSKPERQRRAAANQAWCRTCKTWLPFADVVQGACRPHIAAEARARYRGPAGAVIRAQKRARLRGLDPIPPWWSQERFEFFDGACAYGCGRKAYGLDHIWPVVRGGRSVPGNLVPACRSCNSSKSSKHPAPWVNQGINAFPDSWCDVATLALEHGTDEWLETPTPELDGRTWTQMPDALVGVA